MTLPDRPQRPQRTAPVPAPDANVDPIDYPYEGAAPSIPVERKVAPKKPTTARVSDVPKQTKEATVQLGDRVAASIDSLIAATKERTGMTRRAIIERAIRETWGDSAT